MNWRAEGGARREEQQEEEPLHPLPPTSHHSNYQPLKENIVARRVIPTALTSDEGINKSTKLALFKHRVKVAHSTVWEQKRVFI